MDKERLNESLFHLRDELKTVADVDEASRESLRRLDEDIHRVLRDGGASAVHHAGLRDSLEDSVRHFEASHPAITALMNRLIKALGDMGI